MVEKYEFSFGYLALKMLGKTLYSNPFAALSELIANGFDAQADKVWVYLDIRDKKNAEVIVIDNGTGMDNQTVKDKYLQVGKENRNDDDNIMMGRKGIGKLAAFYLSNKYYVVTKTENESNFYEIDFTGYEEKDKRIDDVNYEYINRIGNLDFANKNIYEKLKSGTAIVMKNVSFVGYGEKSFAVLESELSELFSFGNISKKIYLKVVVDNNDISNEYIEIKKRIAFKNMSKILYNLPDTEFENVIALNGTPIKNNENLSNETVTRIIVEKYNKEARESVVGNKKVKIKPKGWIGIHHTINRELAHKNDEENFINSKFYEFNKIRIYIRGKLALENILPRVHNTQYYVHYIEGEIHCDELDLNDFPDITSSSRQDLDKNDDRVIALVEYVKSIVNILVNFKDKQTIEDKKRQRNKQINAVKELSDDIEESLIQKKGRIIEEKDIIEIKHSVTNSFESVKNQIKTDYKIFLSHRRCDKYVSDFIFQYLTTICGFDEKYIFYSARNGGIDQSIKTLEKQINETLTSNNTYVVFCIASEKYKESEYCMFEGGAAWAVKQKGTIGLIYNDYDDYVPNYLKNMPNIQVNFSNTALDSNTYISIVKLLNSLITYLNRNFMEDNSKKAIIKENIIPNQVELAKLGKSESDYYNKDVLEYWNCYIVNKGA